MAERELGRFNVKGCGAVGDDVQATSWWVSATLSEDGARRFFKGLVVVQPMRRGRGWWRSWL